MFQLICEFFGCCIGALAGAIASSRVKMDLFGVIICGVVAALGGGTVRDMILDIPIYWTVESGESYLWASVVTAFLTFFISMKWKPPVGSIRIGDAISMALFCMFGTQKAWAYGYSATVSVLMGICTGVAGGLLRDILTGNVPYVFRPGELYATAGLFGCVCYVVMAYYGLPTPTCFVTGFLVTLATRLAAIKWNWSLPSYIPFFPNEDHEE